MIENHARSLHLFELKVSTMKKWGERQREKTWFNFCTYLVLYFFHSCIGTLSPFQPFIPTFSMGSFWMNEWIKTQYYLRLLSSMFLCCCHCWCLLSGERIHAANLFAMQSQMEECVAKWGEIMIKKGLRKKDPFTHAYAQGSHTYSCNILCNFHCDPKHLT